MKIAGGICRLERCDRFWGWIYNIAGNCVRDNFRRKKAVSTVRFSAMEGYQLDGVLMDRKGGAEEGMMVEEGAAEVFEAVERLKENVREIFKMRCCEGMAYSEIGDAVGCSETSARVTFLRAKNRIRRDLGELAEAV
jgi:RNA polymerase sigma factor (sigma-70 family)